MTYKVVEDAQHRIWFGTDRGLVCLHPETDSLQIFTRNDGLPDNQFNYKSALAASDGTIWMGTINGLVSFNPQIVRRNTFVPPVYITGMYVQGRETPFPADGVQLPYRSNVGFDFVALSYTSPGANRYAYKMEGIDNDWNYTSAAHTASYAFRRETICFVCVAVIMMVSGIRKKPLCRYVFFHPGGVQCGRTLSILLLYPVVLY